MIVTKQDRLSELLAEGWSQTPSMRFGQLVSTNCGMSGLEGNLDVEDVANHDLLARLDDRVHAYDGVINPTEEASPPSLRDTIIEEFDELRLQFSQCPVGRLASRVAARVNQNLYDIEDTVFLSAVREFRDANENPIPETYKIVFPDTIATELAYPDRLSRPNFRPITIPDSRRAIAWYFEVMTGGRAYEQATQSDANRAKPNVLTKVNFQNARRISGIGWRYEHVEDLFDVPCPELEAIPEDADLLVTNRFDEPAGRLVRTLMGRRGIKLANATKILYQKRPGMFPILDVFVRQAMNIPWIWESARSRKTGLAAIEKETHGEYHPLSRVLFWLTHNPSIGAFGLGLRQVRYLASFANNGKALSNLQRWFESELSAQLDIGCLSRSRVLDILAWSAIWLVNHRTTEESVSSLITMDNGKV